MNSLRTVFIDVSPSTGAIKMADFIKQWSVEGNNV